MNVAILGASRNRAKFGNKAVRSYLTAGHRVFPVNLTEEVIEGQKCFRKIREIPERIDRALIYTSPEVSFRLLDEVAEKGVREVFLNPGSEDDSVIRKAEALHLNIVLACSIVAIGRNPQDFN